MKLFGVQSPSRRARIRRFGSVAGPSAYEGPLDLLPGAVAAYGLRALGVNWIGENVVRLRRDSDDEEMDFAAGDDGIVDVAAVTTWLAGADGFCVTLYDQSGNGKDATMATPEKQPQWVADAQNGRPALFFTNDTVGSPKQLDTAERVDLPDGESSAAVVFNETDNTGNLLFLVGMNILENVEDPYWEIRILYNTAASEWAYHVEQWVTPNNAGNTLPLTAPTIDITTGLHLFDTSWKFGEGAAALDGDVLPYANSIDVGGVVGQINQRLSIGSGDLDPLSTAWEGHIAEFILYADIKDMSVCRQNIATYYGITLT